MANEEGAIDSPLFFLKRIIRYKSEKICLETKCLIFLLVEAKYPIIAATASKKLMHRI
jgi:hypothetical protein